MCVHVCVSTYVHVHMNAGVHGGVGTGGTLELGGYEAWLDF